MYDTKQAILDTISLFLDTDPALEGDVSFTDIVSNEDASEASMEVTVDGVKHLVTVKRVS